MDAFLKSCKRISNYDDLAEVHVVMGNSACDLDSVVSSLVYAYYLWKKNVEGGRAFIPLLNIQQEELRLRTEVTYFLKRCSLDIANLCFRENINIKALHDEKKLKLVLVDHNQLDDADSEVSSSVVEVIDHHMINHNTIDREKMQVEMVGSCATLVAERLLHGNQEIVDDEISLLLLGAIALDTVNFDDNAKRVTDKDKAVAAQLSSRLSHLDVNELFREIHNAKFDTSGLSIHELLRRDVKKITSKTINIIVPSLNVSIETVLKYPTIETELEELRTHNQCHSVVLMGMNTNSSGEMYRQIAVYTHIASNQDQVVDILQTSQPKLCLMEFPSGYSTIVAFHQGNVGASRKVILPLLQKLVAEELTCAKNTDVSKISASVVQDTIGSSNAHIVHQHVGVTKQQFTNSDASHGEISPSCGETSDTFLGPPHQLLGAGDPWSTVASSKNSSNQNSCPYTPLNSVAESESGIDQYAMHILPSFNSRDMLEKIAKKRNKLGEYIGDLSVTDTYPYTPKNSYVEGSFDGYAKGLPHFDAQALCLKVEEQKCSQEHDITSPVFCNVTDSNCEEVERANGCEPSQNSADGKPTSNVAGVGNGYKASILIEEKEG